MKDQHTKIKGYRDLSQEEIDLMNEVKELGNQFEQVRIKLETYLTNQAEDAMAADLRTNEDRDQGVTELQAAELNELELERLAQAEPDKWLNLGIIDIQKGLMAVIRSVAQPASF